MGIALLLLGIGCLLTAPASAQEPAGELNVTSNDFSASAGETTTIQATVRNDGNRSLAEVEVWIDQTHYRWNTSNATIQKLPANESQTVELNVSIPDDFDPGVYNLTIRAETPENVTGEVGIHAEIPHEDHPTETATDGGSSQTDSTPGGAAGPVPVKEQCSWSIPVVDICLDGLLDGLWPF